MSNTFGNSIRLSIFGESHGEAIGMILDGLEPGTKIDEERIAFQMARRAPGGALATKRKEPDRVELVSGVVNGISCSSPICGIIHNTNTRSKDYDQLASWMRPSHSDYPAYVKYHGFNDVRGGGHFSGRITAPLVLAGTLCEAGLNRHMELTAGSHVVSLGSYAEPLWELPQKEILLDNEKKMIPAADPETITEIISQAAKEGDSVGGIVETAILGVPVGLGDPFFDSLESRLSQLLFSIPAVKGVLFGAGDRFALMRGSEANDAYYYDDEKVIRTKTNHNGGILGGISNGAPIVFRTVIKPTASIAKTQESVNVRTEQNETASIVGRHDPCIVLRAVPVIEAAAKIAIYDAFREGKF